MKRLVVAVAALAVPFYPMLLHASGGHPTQSRVLPHHVVRHASPTHYTEKSQPHEVVKHWHPRYVTNKAVKHKVAHAKHKKIKRH